MFLIVDNKSFVAMYFLWIRVDESFSPFHIDQPVLRIQIFMGILHFSISAIAFKMEPVASTNNLWLWNRFYFSSKRKKNGVAFIINEHMCRLYFFVMRKMAESIIIINGPNYCARTPGTDTK